MKELAKISFYSITECGYYEFGKEGPEFGDIDNILSELKYWAFQKGMTLSKTCPYEIQESEDILRTFCFDLIKSKINGDYLLTTWNETPATEGNIASVNGNKAVGMADVNLTRLPEDYIPGYATYFWFIPAKNIFATIRFHHRLNGQQNLLKFLREFSAKFTSHVITEENDEIQHYIVGYCKDGVGDPKKMIAKFKTELYKKPGELKFIKENRVNIRKIIRKNSLLSKYNDQKDKIQQVLNLLGITKSTKKKMEFNIKLEVPISPSAGELDEMIADWDENHDTKWDDIGFVFNGEQDPRWLSHALAKDTFELDVKRDNIEVINAESILNAITERRESILALLK